MLLDGQSLLEKCKLQHDQIIRLRRESQGLQYRKSAWKENYRKAEVELKSERQRAYKKVKDLEEKVRDLSQQVENLEGKLKRARCAICLIGFSDTVLSCGYIFCQGCLLEWDIRCRATTGHSMTCLICRVKSNFSLLIYETL